MRIYLDTEFTDLVGIVVPIRLISAGFVAKNGQEFYFELTDNYQPLDCNDFVREAVLPFLDTAKHGMMRAQAASRLRCWLEAFGEPVQLASDAPGYDCPLIAGLFEEYGWPANLSQNPHTVNAGNVQQEINNYFTCQPMAIRHHALWDARALAYAAMIEDKYWVG